MTSSQQFKDLPPGKRLYFASDFHLGIPNKEDSLERERCIIRWLDEVSSDAAAIILVGDIFDFWFEYPNVIPKGFIRFQGKLAQLRDEGIPVIFFTGNHDMWMFDYFPKELGISVHREPLVFEVGEEKLFVGHGDGLGPGDHIYKLIKLFFASKVCQWMFKWLHPNVGMRIAQIWSSRSRLASDRKEVKSYGEKEWLYQYILQVEKENQHDYYIFGHRHLPADVKGSNFQYVNLGEWVHHRTYAVYDGSMLDLRYFEA